MKRLHKTWALALTAIGLTVGSLQAADTPAPSSAPAPSPAVGQHEHGGKHVKRGGELKRLADALNLTADQRDKIKDLFKQRREAMKALPKEEARGQKGQEIRDAYRAKIRAVLTPEQQAKFDAIKDEAASRRGEREEHPQ